jgi:hypothetical protein
MESSAASAIFASALIAFSFSSCMCPITSNDWARASCLAVRASMRSSMFTGGLWFYCSRSERSIYSMGGLILPARMEMNRSRVNLQLPQFLFQRTFPLLGRMPIDFYSSGTLASACLSGERLHDAPNGLGIQIRPANLPRSAGSCLFAFEQTGLN